MEGENEFFVPSVAVAPDGEAVAVWRNAINGVGAVVESATETGGVWSEPVELGAGFFYSGAPRVAIDGGEAVAIWERGQESARSRSSRRANPGVAPGRRRPNWPARTKRRQPSLAISAGGLAVAAWISGETDKRALHSSVRAAAGSRLERTNRPQRAGRVGLPDRRYRRHGDAVVSWEAGASAGTVGSVEVVGFDGAGPEIRTVSIPGSNIAGVPIAFSVNAVDVWSSVSSVAWSFGDGTGTKGAAVSHVYNAPGRYPIGISAVDALGNSTIASGAVNAGADRRASPTAAGPRSCGRARPRSGSAARAAQSTASPNSS